MATVPATETTTTTTLQENDAERRSWGDITVSIAGQIAAPNFSRGDLASLRRMNPDKPDAAVFWRLLAHQDLLEGREMSRDMERRWGLILHGIALMTPTANDDANTEAPRPSAHNPTVPVGLALFQGGDAGRGQAFYSATRFNRLLTARGDMLRILLARLFRMLASADQPFNWRQMANLILNDERNEAYAEQARRRIARAYYQAERRANQQSST